MKLSANDQQWLDKFREIHGRAPRILHIGNIANNAYNNAKMLNEVGIESDVICYNYYHIMGSPEWEDADFSGDFSDHFKPDWVAAGVKNFVRPRWFAQGPLENCIDFLVARKEGNANAEEYHWNKLSVLNRTSLPKNSYISENINVCVVYILFYSQKIKNIILNIITSRGIASRISLSCDRGRIAALFSNEICRLFFAWLLIAVALTIRLIGIPFRRYPNLDSVNSFEDRCNELVNTFAVKYPTRIDSLTSDDMRMYSNDIIQWKRLFEHYDLIQAYATDPILPMLLNKRPYIGFEHGTLRSHTMRDDSICRLTSLAYNMADHVFITNGDCLEYAKKIGVTRYTPMLHPIDERRILQIEGRYEELRRELGVRYVFLCTLRHDWAIKGTDMYIRAIPAMASLLGSDFRVIMTKWGEDLDKSILLAQSLGVSDLIVWVEPLGRKKLIEMLKSSDILFDQLSLPHFGATAPEGIAAGIPVIMSYDANSTEWIIQEPAPILSAHNIPEIVEQVQRALDPMWLESYRHRAAEWFDKNHSSRRVIQTHIDSYRRLIPII